MRIGMLDDADHGCDPLSKAHTGGRRTAPHWKRHLYRCPKEDLPVLGFSTRIKISSKAFPLRLSSSMADGVRPWEQVCGPSAPARPRDAPNHRGGPVRPDLEALLMLLR